jgi:hypothetical protein
MNESPFRINVFFQDTENRIRVFQHHGGWNLNPNPIATGLPGTPLATLYNGNSLRVMLRWPDGRLSWVASEDFGATYGNNPTLSDSNILKANSPLTGGAWQRDPRGNGAGPLDQIRAFYTTSDGSIGTYVIDDRKGKDATLNSGPATDGTQGKMAYITWISEGIIHQRLYVQKGSREIVEYRMEGIDGPWSTETALPIV